MRKLHRDLLKAIRETQRKKIKFEQLDEIFGKMTQRRLSEDVKCWAGKHKFLTELQSHPF